jgi:WD40 repeat protein
MDSNSENTISEIKKDYDEFYDLKLKFTNIPEMFNCRVCNNLPINPETCKNCQKIFCEGCIFSKLKDTNGICPECKENYIKYPLHYTIKNILSDFYFPCIYKANGCSSVVKYNQLSSHIENCLYAISQCPICFKEMKKIELEEHYDKCQTTELICQNCFYRGNKLRFSEHLKFCDHFKYLYEASQNFTIERIKEVITNLNQTEILLKDQMTSKNLENDKKIQNLENLTKSEISKLEENLNIFKISSISEDKKISENLSLEITRIDNEISKTSDEILKNRQEIDSNKNLMKNEIKNILEKTEIQFLDLNKSKTVEITELNNKINSKNSDLLEFKKDFEIFNKQINSTINSLREEIVKHSQVTQIQINSIKEENKRVLEDLQIDKQTTKIDKLNLEEKLKEEAQKYQKELACDIENIKVQWNRLNEDLQKLNETNTTLKVENYRNKILLEDKLNTLNLEQGAALKKTTEFFNLEISNLKKENSELDEKFKILNNKIDQVFYKLDVMDNEYSSTLKNLLDSLQLEIEALEKDLKNRSELLNINSEDILQVKTSLEESLSSLRGENMEIRKIVNNLKIDINNLSEELVKYENTYTERFKHFASYSFEEGGDSLPNLSLNQSRGSRGHRDSILLMVPSRGVEDTDIHSKEEILISQGEVPEKNISPLKTSSNVFEPSKTQKIISDKFDKENVIPTESNIFSLECLSLKFSTIEKDINSTPKIIIKDYLLTGHRDGSIQVWDIDTLSKYKFYHEHKSFVDDIKSVFSSNNPAFSNMFISCSKDTTIKLWDINKPISIKTIHNDSWNFCLAHLLNFNDSQIAVGDDNKTIKVYNFENGSKIKTILTGHSHGVARLLHINKITSVKDYSNNLLLSSSKPDIKLWDLDTNKLLATYKEHRGWVNSLCYLKEDLFCSGSDDSIRIWRFSSETSVRNISVSKSMISSILYYKIESHNSTDENHTQRPEEYLITGSLGKTMKIIKLENPNEDEISKCKIKLIKSKERSQSIFKMVFLKNNNLIASIYWASKNLKIWGDIKNPNNSIEGENKNILIAQ